MTYRLSELEIPDDNPFENDTLDRRPLVDFLSNLIGRIDEPFVLALDSPWGSGKTTLIRMLAHKLKNDGTRCVYFNAWEVDYATDPLIALVASFDRTDFGDASSYYKKHLATVRKVTAAVAKRGLVAAAKMVTLGVVDVS